MEPRAHALLSQALSYDKQYELAERALMAAADGLGMHALRKNLGQLYQYMIDPPRNADAIRQYQCICSTMAQT